MFIRPIFSEEKMELEISFSAVRLLLIFRFVYFDLVFSFKRLNSLHILGFFAWIGLF